MPIEYTIIISVISVTCTLLGVSIAFANMRRAQSNDDKSEGATIAMITHIDENVGSIKHDMKDIKADIKEQRDRLVRVEESTKSAHKRLDELTGRRGGGAGAE